MTLAAVMSVKDLLGVYGISFHLEVQVYLHLEPDKLIAEPWHTRPWK